MAGNCNYCGITGYWKNVSGVTEESGSGACITRQWTAPTIWRRGISPSTTSFWKLTIAATMASVAEATLQGEPSNQDLKLETDRMGSLYISLQTIGVPVMALVNSGSNPSVIHPAVLSGITGEQDMVRKSSSWQLPLADGVGVDTLGNVNTYRACRTCQLSAICRISKTHFTEGEGLVEGTCSPLLEGNVALAKMMVKPTLGNLCLYVANLINEPQIVFKGMEVTRCEAVGVLPDED